MRAIYHINSGNTDNWDHCRNHKFLTQCTVIKITIMYCTWGQNLLPANKLHSNVIDLHTDAFKSTWQQTVPPHVTTD